MNHGKQLLSKYSTHVHFTALFLFKDLGEKKHVLLLKHGLKKGVKRYSIYSKHYKKPFARLHYRRYNYMISSS